jgi:UDP-N-acetylmuramoyl-tripeptide--D-alanyl-D-alanine ligase
MRVADALGVPGAIVREGIAATTLPFGRSRVVRGERTVLVDCYNANPDSMRAAIETVTEIAARQGAAGTVFVLGAMKELGERTERDHRALVAFAAAAKPDLLVLVGNEFATAEPEEAFAGTVVRVPEAAALRRELSAHLRPNQVVLLKGSRALELEQLEELVVGSEITSGAGR